MAWWQTLIDMDIGWDWGISAALTFGAVLAGLILHKVAFFILHRVTSKTSIELDNMVIKYGQGPSRLIFPL